jgi:hypothetical protein
MKFPDYFAIRHPNQYGDMSRWHVETTPSPAKLVVQVQTVASAEPPTVLRASVPVCDLDPDKVAMFEADNTVEDSVPELEIRSAYYRDAIVHTRGSSTECRYRSVSLRLPLKREITDLPAVKKDFQTYLAALGARRVELYPNAVADLLNPIQEALKPAQGVRIHSADKLLTYEQTVTLDTNKILLTHRSKRLSGQSILSRWGLSGFFGATHSKSPTRVTTESFELLAADVGSGDARRMPEQDNVWQASFTSIEQLPAGLTDYGDAGGLLAHEIWQVSVFFPSEATAQHFVTTCKDAVIKLRERLYALRMR